MQAFVEARTKIFSNIIPLKDYLPDMLLVISRVVCKEFKVEIKAVYALP